MQRMGKMMVLLVLLVLLVRNVGRQVVRHGTVVEGRQRGLLLRPPRGRLLVIFINVVGITIILDPALSMEEEAW